MSLLESLKKAQVEARKAMITGGAAAKEINKVAADALTCLLSDSEKLAKEKLQEAQDSHVAEAAKRWVKRTQDAIDDISKRGNVVADSFHKELEIFKNFAPKTMSQEEVEAKVNEVLSKLSEAELIKSAQGKIMGLLKSIEGIDMKIASAIVSKKLK